MTSRQTLLAIMAPLCWGVGFTVAKPAVTHFPPLFMMFLIYGSIAIVMALTSRDKIRTPWTTIMLIAALAVTIQGAFIFGGLRGLSATTATLVLQIQVPISIVIAWMIGAESFDLRKLIGTLVSLLGVAMVVGLPEDTPPLIPVVMMIVGSFIWALGQVMIQTRGRDSGMLLLKANALAGTPQLLLATLLLESGQIEALRSAGTTEWLTLAFVGVVGFYLAYSIWFTLLRQCRMDDVAPYLLLMPLTGFITAALFLGETISLAQVLGGLVILLGLAIVSIRFPVPKRT